MSKIIIRVDDVGWGIERRVDYPFMEDYSKFHSLFAERQIPYCPCIIPSIVSFPMVAWMFDNFYSEVTSCLHGYSHERSIVPDDEFSGLTDPTIKRRVASGVRELEPLKVYGMSAPWNRYNYKLINACKLVGLKFFFGGYGREKPEKFTCDDDGFVLLPVTVELYVRSGGKESVMAALDSLKEQEHPYVLTLHCTWEYPDLGSGKLEYLLDKIIDNFEVLDAKKWLTEFSQ